MAGGASAFSDDDGGAISEINITPLVDIVLVLLIVFMITMPTIEKLRMLRERELGVQLPSASTAVPLTVEPSGVTINIRENGEYVLESQPVSEVELQRRLEQAKVDNPDRVHVEIRCDKRAGSGHLVAVLDLCKKLEINDFGIATEDE